jgi:chromatin remodeling complex protein RSC6
VGGGEATAVSEGKLTNAQLPRTTVVKKLWEHIKGNNLQDPKDKRQICCDEKMYAIFKQAKIDMFQMNKAIGNHLYPVEEE